jgi:Na+-driven multidrug efflux pump
VDPLLIFGPGPFPALGIAGAAWATVLGRGLSLLAVLWVLLFRDRMLTTPWVAPRVVLASWKRLIRNGAPIALNNLITPVISGGLTRLIAGMGTAAVAGFGVASRLEALSFTGIYALQSVIAIYIGQNAGAGRWDRVETGLHKCQRFGLYWGTSVLLLMALFGRTIAAWFDPDPNVVSAAYCYAVVAGLGFGWRGVYLLASAGLNSLNHAALATVLTVVQGIGITLPCAWWFGRYWGLPGICTGVTLGSVAGGVATAIMLRRQLAHRRRHGLE